MTAAHLRLALGLAPVRVVRASDPGEPALDSQTAFVFPTHLTPAP